MSTSTKQFTILCSLASLFCFADGLSAQKITAKTKSGYSSSIEVLGVVGDSLQFKNLEGATKLLRLSEFDEETLIRIIKKLSKRKKTTSSSTPAKTNPLGGNDPIPGNLPGQEVTVAQLENLPERYLRKKIKMTGAKFKQPDPTWTKIYKLKDHIGFDADDPNGKFYTHFIISKRQADLVLGLKKGQHINVSGSLSSYSSFSGPGFFFEVEKLEIVK